MARREHAGASRGPGAAPRGGADGTRAPALALYTLAVLFGLSGCAGQPAAHTPAPPTATAPAPSELLEKRPELATLGAELSRHAALVSATERLLLREPPVQPELVSHDRSEEAQARLRQRIEAYFERGLRFEEAQRVAGIELMGQLAEAQEHHPQDVLPTALAGLLLADLSALGYDSASAAPPPEALQDLTDFPVAMAHARVAYSALSADAYALCAARANVPEQAAIRTFCERQARSARLHAQQLPQCTAASVLQSEEAFPSALPKAPNEAGLLLLGAYGAPLLEGELLQVMQAVHRMLPRYETLPLLPLAETSTTLPPVASCATARLPSERLFAAHPNARWYGLSLHCPESGGACVLSVCGDGEVGCLRAEASQRSADVNGWLAAAARLRPSSEGLLLESSGDVVSAPDVGVSLSQVRVFGAFPERGQPARLLAEQQPALLSCQRGERYAGTWTIRVDRAGSVVGTRSESTRAVYPLDEGVVVGEQGACIEQVLRNVRFEPTQTGERRIMVSLEVPARIQVDVPFALRKDGALGSLPLPARLGRDDFALGVSRCAALAKPALTDVGICLQIAPDCHIRELALDTQPGRLGRLLVPDATLLSARMDLEPVQACLRETLAHFDWGCRKDGPDGHVAMTFFLPRGLVERF